MKKLSKIQAHKIVLGCFLFAFIHILFYELVLMQYNASSEIIYKLGIIFSRISYSIIAASIFYYLSQYFPVYLPKQERKRKILAQVFQKTIMIGTVSNNLKFNLKIYQDDFMNNESFKKALEAINPDKAVNVFMNWYEYLFHVKTQLLDIIRSMPFYDDYLSVEFLQELMILEKQLFSDNTFSGQKTLSCSDLTYTGIDLQEILVHNKNLQDLRMTELKKYEKIFQTDGAVYRKKYFDE